MYRNLSILERAGVVQKVVTSDEWARFELAEDLTEQAFLQAYRHFERARFAVKSRRAGAERDAGYFHLPVTRYARRCD